MIKKYRTNSGSDSLNGPRAVVDEDNASCTAATDAPPATCTVVLVMPGDAPSDGPPLSADCLRSMYRADRRARRKDAGRIASALRMKTPRFAADAAGCIKFRHVATCGGSSESEPRLDIYGYRGRVADAGRRARVNRHELPGDARLPSCSKITALYSDLSYGPIVVVRRRGSDGLDFTAEEYGQYIHRVCDSESIHSSESRSTSGSDNGTDLDDFIVADGDISDE